MTRMSTELAEDAAINVADDLAREMAYAFATAEDAAGWNGDGTSTYGGIMGMRTKFAAGVGSFVGAVDLTSGHDTFADHKRGLAQHNHSRETGHHLEVCADEHVEIADVEEPAEGHPKR